MYVIAGILIDGYDELRRRAETCATQVGAGLDTSDVEEYIYNEGLTTLTADQRREIHGILFARTRTLSTVAVRSLDNKHNQNKCTACTRGCAPGHCSRWNGFLTLR